MGRVAVCEWLFPSGQICLSSFSVIPLVSVEARPYRIRAVFSQFCAMAALCALAAKEHEPPSGARSSRPDCSSSGTLRLQRQCQLVPSFFGVSPYCAPGITLPDAGQLKEALVATLAGSLRRISRKTEKKPPTGSTIQ
jgi:hypothetical protein